MSDLVERLRLEADTRDSAPDEYSEEVTALIREAADRIASDAERIEALERQVAAEHPFHNVLSVHYTEEEYRDEGKAPTKLDG